MKKSKKLDKKNIEDILALTPMQEGMLFHYLKDPESEHYFEQLSLEISGEIDIDIFEKAWNFVIETNEMLRALFRWEKLENPVQIILKEHKLQPEYYSFLGGDTSEKKKRLEEIKTKDRKKKFDLREVPFRVILCKTSEDKYEITVSNHHILYDGWSNGIILKEFFYVYNDLSMGRALTKPGKTKFKEFIRWIRNRDIETETNFWKGYLSGFDTLAVLSIKAKKSNKASGTGSHHIHFSDSFKDELQDFVTRNKLTMAALLYTAWGLLLQKYNNSDDVIFGTTISGRSAKVKGIEDIVGLFINTLPLRIKTVSRETILETLERVHHICSSREEYETTSLMRIKEYSEIDNKGDLFDCIVVIENYPLDKRLMEASSSFSVNSTANFGINEYHLTVGITIFDDIEIRLTYNEYLFDEEIIARLSNHFLGVLQKVISNHESKVSALEIVSQEEKKEILNVFNNRDTIYPGDKTIKGLFEEQVNRNPGNTAVVYGNTRLSYLDLDTRVRRLAVLLKKKGVISKSIVAVISEPSMEVIIGILAVIKAGGTYLPIEVECPVNRIRYMLNDSKARIALTDKNGKQLTGKIAFGGEVVNIEEIDICDNGDTANLKNITVPTDPVYMIYTSGTTGSPKGVLIKNENLSNYVDWFTKEVNLTGEDKAILVSSFAFDLGYTAIYPTVIQGGQLHILPKMIHLNPESLLKYIKSHDITFMKSTPSFLTTVVHCTDFSAEVCASLRFVILGGEPINLKDVEQLHLKCNHIKIMNHYGPTETTIGSVAGFINFSRFDEYRLNPTIGKPIDKTNVYILDKHLNLLPIYVPGELYIGGDGVGTGYLNRPELTVERFTENPFFAESTLYRTGDLARWHWDGSIEFIGRTDNQVKVRGYRIELGEIEDSMLKHDAIKEALVMVNEDENGNKYIAAYVVHAVHDRDIPVTVELDLSEIREYLANELPEYMIPSYIVPLEELPLTPNGKVDRTALPNAKEFSPTGQFVHVAPGNWIEEKLVEIWEKVLDRNKIGVNEDFFQVGGDSIKAIQIISKLNKIGYKASIKDIFQNSSISQLSLHIKKTDGTAEQSAVTGIVPLTPIQKEFFLYSKRGLHYYNQAVLLYSEEPVEKEAVKAVFKKLQEHHDALRMNHVVNPDGEIIQTNRGLDQQVSFLFDDFRDQENALKALEKKVNEIHSSIDLGKGPLMKLGLFRLDDGDRLLIVIHHLVVDTVSWRILFEDIGNLFEQYQKGEKFILPEKTDSFKLWAKELSQYANSESLLKEKSYWARLESTEIQAIERDFDKSGNYIKDTDMLFFHLKEHETNQLLTKANDAFGTEVIILLLTALSLAVRRTFGNNQLLIALEGHGREEIIKDVDISRTVGWFTSIYPVLLDASYANDLARQLKEVKEILGKIPNKGIGYGILKYLSDEKYKGEIEFGQNPRVGFNYLGQFDRDVKQMPFEIARESAGNFHDPDRNRKYDFDLIGMIVGKQLRMSITYNKNQFKTETVARFLGHYKTEMCRIISFCAARGKREFTPGDYSYKGLSIEALDRLSMQYPIEDIYTLTPTQEGMLFHALYESSSAYFVQISFQVHGKLNIPLVKKSLNQLFKRHDILRTAFIHEGIDRPVQLVLREREVDFLYRDIREIASKAKKDTFIKEFKENDRKRLFSLSRDVLMRICVIQVDEAEYVFTWSNHHILMDGWCRGVLNSEFLEIYSSYLENRPVQLPAVKPYRMYIQWLEQQDKESAKKYWENLLKGYKEAVSIPKRDVFGLDHKSYKGEEVLFTLESEKTCALSNLAAKNRVTLNIIIKTIWGILLAKYNNKHDVVFGIVVSGRPYEIEGVESMVGLFINTIPVRIRYEKGIRFIELLHQVRKAAVDSEPHQYYPLAEIQSASELKQNLLDHILVYENYPVAEQIERVMREVIGDNEGLTLKLSNLDRFEQTNYDFNVIVVPGEQLNVRFDYNANVYEGGFVKKVANHFKKVIHQVLNHEEQRVGELTLLSGEEKKEVLFDFNNTKTGYPGDKTIHELFEEQVEKRPGNTAIVYKNRKLTYRELNEKANHLAELLRKKGVMPDTPTGIMAERSLQMMVGIFGILKAGGAYLPIDPLYPDDRIKHILEESGVKLLLIQKRFKNRLGVVCELIELEDANIYKGEKKNPTRINTSRDLAYVIYTSGSTGRPKGVMIEQGAIINRLIWMQRFYPIGEEDVILQKTPIVFDVSVWELFWWSSQGASVCLLGPGEEKSPEAIIEAIETNKITTMHFVPSMLNAFLEYLEVSMDLDRLSSLKQVFSSGEALWGHQVTTFNKLLNKKNKTKLINLYGPTEAAIDVSYYNCPVIEKTGDVTVPIGKPIDNIRLYVVNKDMGLQPVAVPGELWISGVGLARGYLNRPALTGEKFVDWSPGEGERLYRTGDLCKWLPDGNIEFLGRIDHQVKIRGFRIEPGEIESELLKHETIKECVVLLKDGKSGNKYLCAYFVSGYKEITPGELKDYLSQKLPDYMVPAYFIQLEKLPLTPNGKVDRKALPGISGIMSAFEEYAAPVTQIEKKISSLWEEVLGVEKVGIKNRFFSVGGDSLKSIRLISLINNRLKVNLQIIDLYQNETIEKLAGKIEQVKQVKEIPAEDESKGVYKYIEELKNRILSTNNLLDPRNIEDLYPMTEIEKGMVFDYLKYLDAAVYHDQFMVQFRYEEFDRGRFNRALALMAGKHPILRTSFNIDDFEECIQIVHKEVNYDVEHFDISGLRKAEQEEYINNFLLKDLEKKFKVLAAPLWRLRVFLLGGDEVLIALICHHAIIDGWSFASLITELYEIDGLLKLNPEYVPGALEITYKDAVVREMVEKQRSEAIAYWKNELNDYKKIDFFGKVKNKDEIMNRYEDYLDGSFFRALINTAGKYKTTVKNLCFGAYVYVMSMLSYENDILVGLVSNNRPVCEDGDKLIGCFLNTVPIRIKVPTALKWVDYIHLVEKKLLEVKKYERMPLFDIIRTAVEKTRDSQSIFETLFNFVDFHVYNKLRQLKSKNPLEIVSHMNTNTQFDFEISTTLEEFLLLPKYNRSAISDEVVNRSCIYFKRILDKFIFDPGSLINRNEIIPTEEKQRILEEFNDTTAEYTKDTTLSGIFEEQVEKNPDNTAVVGRCLSVTPTGKKEVKRKSEGPPFIASVSYSELNRKANQLAGALREKGIKTNCFVGVIMDRSIEMILGVMGIIKAGGAYVPLEPYLPEARLGKLLSSLNVECILTNYHWVQKIGKMARQLPGFKCIFCLDGEDHLAGKYDDLLGEKEFISPKQIGKNPGKNVRPLAGPEDKAYVIFTSGSTGVPKGVIETHKPVINVIEWVNTTFNINPSDRLLFVASLGFDLSVYDIFGILASGAVLRIATRDDIREPKRLLDIIVREQVTFWDSAPAVMQQIVSSFPELKDSNRQTNLRLVFLSGDWIPVPLPPLLKEAFGGVAVISLGGATEATIWSNYFPIADINASWVSIPYGKPIQNAGYYILDRHLNISPIGVCGDLYIGGQCLASGYINDTRLTAGKFIDNPFSPAGKIYKTGDMARWFEDGNIEFLGRKDNQVKIRGYRIELGEIESHLAAIGRIRDAFVMVRQAQGDKYLCAYFTADSKIEKEELRKHLLTELPNYMIPSYFIQLEKIPLTPNGKVDRKTLPGPELSGEEAYEAPRDHYEEKLVEIWSEVLKIDKERIGIDFNYFELGGHSLNATVAISKIHKELSVKIALAEIFNSPTVRELAAYVKEAEENKYASIQQAPPKDYYPLSSAQKRFYILQQMEIDSTAYNQPQMVEIEGKLDREKLEKTFGKLFKRHEVLRTSVEVVEGEPVQVIHDGVEFRIEYHELHEEIAGKKKQEKERNIIRNFIRAFDMSKAPLMRAGLINIGKDIHILMLDMHHIITDGVSNALLVRDLMMIYSGRRLPGLRLQYKDYSEWQNSQKETGELKQQEKYWLKEFGGDIPLLNLPLDYARPDTLDFEGNIVTFEIAGKESKRLKKMAIDEEVTLYMILLTLYITLLAKISGQEDIVVGIVTTGRRHMDLEQLIGVLINTMAFRSHPSTGKTFKHFLGEVKEKALEAFENQDYQFEDLVEKIGLRGGNRNPLFGVIFGFFNMEDPSRHIHIPGLKWKPYKYTLHRSRFDMVFLGRESGDKLAFSIEYSTRLFKEETLQKFIRYFKNIVTGVLENPDKKIKEIEIMSEEEREIVYANIREQEEEIAIEFDMS